MATTVSSQSYIKETIQDLDVVSTYEELMKVSVGKDSIYIRSKETMQAFFENSNLKDTEKAAALGGMLSSMVSSITGQAMNSALAIAKENREGVYVLTKMREDTKLVQEQADKLKADNELVNAERLLKGQQQAKVTADTNNAVLTGWKLQSDMIRDNGLKAAHGLTTADIILPATSMELSGTKYASILQANAGTHSAIAKSIMESGNVAWTMTNPGAVTATKAVDGLTLAQENVAIRQEIAFEDNKRQHAANSSAAMMSMLISSGDGGLISGDPTEIDPATGLPVVAVSSPLGLWYTAITDLTTDAV